MVGCGSWFVGVHITSTQWLGVVAGLLECILLAHSELVCGSWFVGVHITSTQWLGVVVGLLKCILLAHSGCVW